MADLSARQLMALLGQLRPDTRIRIADLAEEVGVDEPTLIDGLETLAMCGVAPYDPGDLVPLMIEDGYVEVFGELPALDEPVRLSASEARALAAALQAAGFDGDDPLSSKLLEAAAPREFDQDELERTVKAATLTHRSAVYETLAQAVTDGLVVTMEYVRSGASDPTVREFEPHALFAERSAWYTTGWCRSAGAWRTFRLDRIRSAGPTGEHIDPRLHETPSGMLSAMRVDGLPKATLRFAPGARFEPRDWPGSALLESGPDGSATVEVPFGGTEWIARRVVARLGLVEVVEPADVRAAVAALAADCLDAMA